MGFYRGQKVVFVGGGASLLTKGETPPEVGAVYTVRSFREFPDIPATGIRLVEIRNARRQYCDGFYECAFWTGAFRPATDISDLISIVNEVKRSKPRHIEPDQFDAPKRKEKTRAELDVQAFIEWLRAR